MTHISRRELERLKRRGAKVIDERPANPAPRSKRVSSSQRGRPVVCELPGGRTIEATWPPPGEIEGFVYQGAVYSVLHDYPARAFYA